MAWQDYLELTLRSTKGIPLDAAEIDLNFTRIGAFIADLISGHNHDGQNSRAIDGAGSLGPGGWIYENGSITGDENNYLIGGVLRTTNWGAGEGAQIDLIHQTMKFGGYTSPKFQVAADGTLTATDAIISGTISATALNIGGADATSFHVDVDGNLWLGAATLANGVFKVTNAGVMTALNATITGIVTANTGKIGGSSGWTISDGKMTASGLGLATTTGDATYAFWAGNNTPSQAAFNVTHAGVLTATGATISGVITVNTGKIGGSSGWTISAKTITGASDSKIVSGILESSNWGTDAGVQIDLVNKTMKFGGSSAPKFSVAADGSISATGATISGVLTAVSGYIGGSSGWTISAKTITGASDSKIVSGLLQSSDWGLNSGSQIDLVNKTIKFGGSSAPKFSVTATGVVTAIDAVLSGSLDAGSGATSFHVDPFGHLWLGAASFNDAPFSVTHEGVLHAVSGEIAGWTVDETAFYKDAGIDAASSGMSPSDYPFYAGKQYADRATAPFRVTLDGRLTASEVVSGGHYISGYADQKSLELELMKINFQSISWAQFAIYDALDNEIKRTDPDPSTHPARVYQSSIDNGDDSTASRSFGFISKTYANITIIESGTATSRGLNYLTDTAKTWFTDELKNAVLVDSATTEFNISSNTNTTLTVSGTPAAGNYSVKTALPSCAVAFASYTDSTNNDGHGYVKLEVSFDGGSHYQTFLDTEHNIDLLGGTVNISYPGSSFLVRITLKNDSNGLGSYLHKYLICTDPSPWRF